MKRFSLILSPEDRKRLNQARRQWGFRSEAGAIRHLIALYDFVPPPSEEDDKS